eukprot:6492314-Amphidinium_carterae.1
MQTDEYKQAEVLGRAGSTRHKVDGASSFGPTTRAVNRKAMQKVLPIKDDCGKLVLPLQGLLQVPSGPGQPLAAMLKNTLDEEKKIVRKLATASSKARLASLREARKSLQDFLDVHAEPTLAALLEHCPSLGEFSTALHVVPSQNYVLHEVAFDTHRRATHLAAWASGHSRASNLQAVLDSDWHAKSSTVLDPLTVHKAEASTPCKQFGFCVCSATGKLVLQYRNTYHKHLKRCFAKKTMFLRQLLADGHVVVKFFTPIEIPTPAPEPSPWSALLEEFLEECDGDPKLVQQDVVVWAHVGMQYFKPYRSTLQRLRLIELMPDGKVHLEQTGEYQSEFEFIDTLNLSMAWRCHFYQIEATDAPIGALLPAQCIAQEFEHDSCHLWPPVRKPRGPRKGKGKGKVSKDIVDDSCVGDVEDHVDDLPAEDDLSFVESSHEGSNSEGEDANDSEESNDELLLDGLDVLLKEHLVTMVAENETAGKSEVAEPILEAATHDVVSDSDSEHVVLEAPDVGQGASSSSSIAPPPVVVEPMEVEATTTVAAPAAHVEALVGPPIPVPAVARGKALADIAVSGGRIAFYCKGFFQATCETHYRCVLTRTSMAGRRAGQGRPLGLLTSWLAMGPTVVDKASHWDAAAWPNHATRHEHRTLLAQLEGGIEMLSFERDQREDEPEEPDRVA